MAAVGDWTVAAGLAGSLWCARSVALIGRDDLHACIESEEPIPNPLSSAEVWNRESRVSP
jgi:hypothetical protein